MYLSHKVTAPGIALILQVDDRLFGRQLHALVVRLDFAFGHVLQQFHREEVARVIAVFVTRASGQSGFKAPLPTAATWVPSLFLDRHGSRSLISAPGRAFAVGKSWGSSFAGPSTIRSDKLAANAPPTKQPAPGVIQAAHHWRAFAPF